MSGDWDLGVYSAPVSKWGQTEDEALGGYIWGVGPEGSHSPLSPGWEAWDGGSPAAWVERSPRAQESQPRWQSALASCLALCGWRDHREQHVSVQSPGMKQSSHAVIHWERRFLLSG